MNHNKKF